MFSYRMIGYEYRKIVGDECKGVLLCMLMGIEDMVVGELRSVLYVGWIEMCGG